MKKTLLMLFVAALLSVTSEKAFAQFEKGDKLLNAGIGVGGYGYYGSAFAVGASFEYGVHDFISVGAQADINFYSYRGLGYREGYTSLPIAARGSYHYGKHFLTVNELDLYAGPTLGINIDGSRYYTGSPIVIGAFAGARYYFQPAMGVFAELSAGTNVIPLKAGITFKF
jgi:hypothetical protein